MKTLKDRYLEGEEHIYTCTNIFGFLNFCKCNKLDENSSETYYDLKEGKMYILDKYKRVPKY